MSVLRGLLVYEGSSDRPLADHVETIAAASGVDLEVAAPDLSLLPQPPGHVLRDKLSAALQLMDSRCDVVFVHRDQDNQQWHHRALEIADAVAEVCPGLPHACVVPVTMTEAWLLLDEASIREVAGNPRGRTPLGLPKLREVEKVRDPKALLKCALVAAAEHSGRRRIQFQQDFPIHRRQLLERLDPSGPVRELPSWIRFQSEVLTAVAGWELHR
ncbi:MAG: hypothetical protein U0Q15_02085 [Kineosporiaceae bacterium]